MDNVPLHVLCVDDEPNVLGGLTRQLRRHYTVSTAVGGEAGLKAVETSGPFAVILSDMRMPGMDGATFLSRVRELSPDSTRMLLTGYADMTSAIAAVNEGQIFRFLTKPCAPEVLLSALEAAARQHRLITSERVLLEQTLHGCIKTLTDILALANPLAFGRATRAKTAAGHVAARLQVEVRWPIEVAAMLAPIGCIALPPLTAEKLYRGQELAAAEQEMVARMPAIALQLLAPIPRLEPVNEIFNGLSNRFDGTSATTGALAGAQIPIGARILKAVLDLDELECRGMTVEAALAQLRGRTGWYDPTILDALQASRDPAANASAQALSLENIRIGMILVEDVHAKNGMLLVGRGQEVSEGLLERLRNFAQSVGIREPIRVAVPQAS